MEIDIKEFRERLEKEIANGNRNPAAIIQEEIRMAENMKASLMEEMREDTKDFLTKAAAKFDTYVFELQEIEKKLNPRTLNLDQKTALADKQVRKEIEKSQEKLDDMREGLNE